MLRLPRQKRSGTGFQLFPQVQTNVAVGFRAASYGGIKLEEFEIGAGGKVVIDRAHVTWGTDNYACELGFVGNAKPWGADYLTWELCGTPTVAVAWQSALGYYRCWPNPWFWAGIGSPINLGTLAAWMYIKPALTGFTDTGTPFPST